MELTHVFIFYSLHNVYRWSKKSGDGERTYLNGDETRTVWITKMPFNGFYDFNAINYNPMNINAHSKSILIWKLAIDFSRSLYLLFSFSPFSLSRALSHHHHHHYHHHRWTFFDENFSQAKNKWQSKSNMIVWVVKWCAKKQFPREHIFNI